MLRWVFKQELKWGEGGDEGEEPRFLLNFPSKLLSKNLKYRNLKWSEHGEGEFKRKVSFLL